MGGVRGTAVQEQLERGVWVGVGVVVDVLLTLLFDSAVCVGEGEGTGFLSILSAFRRMFVSERQLLNGISLEKVTDGGSSGDSGGEDGVWMFIVMLELE